MKLYLWEGNGISGAYHDDGTLAVLAETPDQARQIVREQRASHESRRAEADRLRDEYIETLRVRDGPFSFPYPNPTYPDWTKTERGAEIWAMYGYEAEDIWDGADAALDREPDQTVELDSPRVVVFNGGGYD